MNDPIRTLLKQHWVLSLGLALGMTVALGASGVVWMGQGWAEPEPVLEDYAYEMPKGAIIPVILLDNLSTEIAYVGQPFSAAVAQEVFVGENRILGKQDRVFGTVTRVEKPIEGRNAILEIAFNRIVLADGLEVPVEAGADTGQAFPYWGGQLTPGTNYRVIPYHIYDVGSYGRAMAFGPREVGIHIFLTPGERVSMVLKQPAILYRF